jgi:hypothetical protein
MTGKQRRDRTRNTILKTVGKDLNLRQLRKSMGTHLSEDTSLTDEQLSAGIALMGHTEATHRYVSFFFFFLYFFF